MDAFVVDAAEALAPAPASATVVTVVLAADDAETPRAKSLPSEDDLALAMRGGSWTTLAPETSGLAIELDDDGVAGFAHGGGGSACDVVGSVTRVVEEKDFEAEDELLLADGAATAAFIESLLQDADADADALFAAATADADANAAAAAETPLVTLSLPPVVPKDAYVVTRPPLDNLIVPPLPRFAFRDGLTHKARSIIYTGPHTTALAW
jgi:hypothetical protein